MNAPLRRSRPYIFWGQTQSLCETCLTLVPTKIQILGNEVWYEKRCKQHGVQSTLVSTDATYWRRCKEFIKPGDKPLAFQRHTEFGCPFDCGLCPDHEQHSCLALIEINEHCNLTCPVCFAESSPAREKQLPLATVERMLDALVASEGEPDLVQLSGGEPTLHPDLFAILDAVRARPIRHVMINTNGLRIAREPEFVARLAEILVVAQIYDPKLVIAEFKGPATVAERSACSGVMPNLTIQPNSCAGLMCQSKPPMSVPKAILTPALSARRKVFSWIGGICSHTPAPAPARPAATYSPT